MKSCQPRISFCFISLLAVANNTLRQNAFHLLWLILPVFLASSCTLKSSNAGDTHFMSEVTEVSDSITETRSLNVIILPPYDELANAGISPDISRYIEDALQEQTHLRVMEFPYQKLINANYHMVFDKKYCRDIVELVEPDIIIMTKLDLAKQTGSMTTDKWNFEIKVYDVTADQQRSSIRGTALKREDINETIEQLREELIDDIFETLPTGDAVNFR